MYEVGQKENRLNNGHVGDIFHAIILVIMLRTMRMKEEEGG